MRTRALPRRWQRQLGFRGFSRFDSNLPARLQEQHPPLGSPESLMDVARNHPDGLWRLPVQAEPAATIPPQLIACARLNRSFRDLLHHFESPFLGSDYELFPASFAGQFDEVIRETLYIILIVVVVVPQSAAGAQFAHGIIGKMEASKEPFPEAFHVTSPLCFRYRSLHW